jgi:cytochrome c oxidase assembly factor CtaG
MSEQIVSYPLFEFVLWYLALLALGCACGSPHMQAGQICQPDACEAKRK